MNKKKIFALQLLNGGFLIELPSDTYLINGVEKYISGNVTFDALPDIKTIVIQKVTTHFVDVNGNQLTVEDYENQLKNLESKGRPEYFDDESEIVTGVHFDILEDEFEYKKFLRNWKHVERSMQQVTAELEFEVIPEIPITNAYVIPMRHLGKDITKNAYQYNRPQHALFAFRELGKKHGFIEATGDARNNTNEFSISTHSGLRFAKISGQYSFSDNEPFDRIFVGSYEECMELVKFDMNYIERKFIFKLNEMKKFADVGTIATVLSDVKSIKNCADTIQYKTVSRTDYTATHNLLNNLINKLETLIINTEKAS